MQPSSEPGIAANFMTNVIVHYVLPDGSFHSLTHSP
jgi:hypothetical protein